MSPSPPPQPGATGPQGGSNRTLWIVLGSCLGGGLLLLICGAVLIFATLTIAGRQVSNVFNEIESGLDAAESNGGFVLPTAAPVDVSEAIEVGTAGRSGDLELSVTNTATEEGDDNTQPRAGSEFLVVEVQATNRGTEEIDSGDALFFSWVQNDTQESYTCCIFSLMQDLGGFGTLAPGDAGQVRLVFEVPSDADALYWVYEAEAGAPLVVRLR